MGKSITTMKKHSSPMVIITIILAIISLINYFVITVNLGYMTPILLLLNIILTIYWIVKAKVIMIIPIVCAITQCFPITAFYSPGFTKHHEANSNSITIASYNVKSFTNHGDSTQNNISIIMSNEKVDIICFQEYTGNKDNFMSYPYSVIQCNDSTIKVGPAIFSKYPIRKNNDSTIFDNSLNGGIYADVNINGTYIRVINCHFQTTGLSQSRNQEMTTTLKTASENSIIRKQQIDAVANLIIDTNIPIILCGDFNDLPLSYSYRKIESCLRDSFKEGGKGFASSLVGEFRELLRIDYIFISKDIQCTRYETYNYVFSDHKPIISVLEYKKKK